MKQHSKELLFGLSEFYKIIKPLCVNEISEKLDVSQSAVSHQLKMLRLSNLVATDKIGKNVYYKISDDHIKVILKYGLEHISEVMQ